jgi:AraC family transcriptional regulator, regulatory protein of adaptative response / methylated-DNA-[protein]-cysteine methyltransferase
MTTLQSHGLTESALELLLDEDSIRDLFLDATEELDQLNLHNPELDAVKVSCVTSPVGPLLLGANDRHLICLQFMEIDGCLKQLIKLQHQFGKPLRTGSHRLLAQAEQELTDYFANKRKQFTVPLKPSGTAFQLKVWSALQQIPYGSTWSYEDIASQIGQPTASRAVGLANGANPIAIIIPCHRVIRKGGNIGGYGGGLWRKERLLHLEEGS